RHEHIALGPSWTVVIFAHPSPLLHTVIASGFCTAPGRVIGHISPLHKTGVCWRLCGRVGLADDPGKGRPRVGAGGELPHPVPRWRLVIGEQGTSGPVLRAWGTAVGSAADCCAVAPRRATFSPT